MSKTIATDAQLEKMLEELPWGDIWISLEARCYYLAKKRYGFNWEKSKITDFSRQIISDVFDKVFVTKERKWNLEAYPEFIDFITGAVDSHFNNVINKEKKEIGFGNEFVADINSEKSLNIEDDMNALELSEFVYNELKNANASDDELMVYECISEGVSSPKEIKAELGIDDVTFHNIWRQLKRKFDKISVKVLQNGYK
jgi:hypothetical protein